MQAVDCHSSLKPQLYHFLAVGVGANISILLGLNVIIYEIGTMVLIS